MVFFGRLGPDLPTNYQTSPPDANAWTKLAQWLRLSATANGEWRMANGERRLFWTMVMPTPTFRPDASLFKTCRNVSAEAKECMSLTQKRN